MEYLEELGIGRRVLMKCILKKSVGSLWNGLMQLRTGKSG
jgi:hypothetical protein